MPTWSDQGPVVPSSGAPKLTIGNPNTEDEQFLLRAFHTFSEAAGSLEKSYATLRSEVGRLRQELEESNRDLAHSLEENRSVRAHLDRILEGLPCGVLVISCDGQITRANPEACRLLGLVQDGGAAAGLASTLPGPLSRLLAGARNGTGEQELNIQCTGEKRWLAARHASIVESGINASVYILRDVSERKRLEETQAKLRREEALAEMSTVLAHEIRNPLGSLELFAGLLAESDMDPECHKWVEHMQAGLNIAVPAVVSNALLRKISADWSHRRPRRATDSRERLMRRLLDCPFQAELGAKDVRVPVSALAQLVPGNVLHFARSASDPASLLIAGQEMFRALPARCGNTRAARVLAPVEIAEAPSESKEKSQ